jgi:hypothetical protein
VADTVAAPHVVERARTTNGKILYARAQQNLGRIIEPRAVAMIPLSTVGTSIAASVLNPYARQLFTCALPARKPTIAGQSIPGGGIAFMKVSLRTSVIFPVSGVGQDPFVSGY